MMWRMLRRRSRRRCSGFPSSTPCAGRCSWIWAFNLGPAGLLKFGRTLSAVEQGDYETAAVEMLDSRWAGQVGQRATRLSEMMLTGEWPADE